MASPFRRPAAAVAIAVTAALVRVLYLRHLLSVGYFVDTDGVAYLEMAQSLLAGRGMTDLFGRPHDYFPPGHPALVALVAAVLRDLVAAGILVSMAAGVAVCVLAHDGLAALRALDRRLPRWAPGAVGLLLAVHPLAVDLSCRIGADALFAALLLLAIRLHLAGRRRGGTALRVAPLAVAGGSYLVKPEGLVYFALIAGWAVAWPEPRPRARRFAIARAAAVLALLVVPYSAWLSAAKGRPALSGKASAWLYGFDERGFQDFVRLNYQLDARGDRVVRGEGGAETRTSPKAWARRYAANVVALGRVLRVVLPFGSWCLALVGAAWLASRRPRPPWSLAAASLLLPLALIPILFVVPRLLSSLLPLLLTLTVLGTAVAPPSALGRRLSLAVLAALGAALASSTARQALAYNVPPDFRAAVAWARAHVEPGDVLAAGKPQLAFHAGATSLPLPDTDPDRLLRFLCLNRARWIALTRADVESRPGLRPVWEDGVPTLAPVFRTAMEPRYELRVYRFRAECPSDGAPEARRR